MYARSDVCSFVRTWKCKRFGDKINAEIQQAIKFGSRNWMQLFWWTVLSSNFPYQVLNWSRITQEYRTLTNDKKSKICPLVQKFTRENLAGFTTFFFRDEISPWTKNTWQFTVHQTSVETIPVLLTGWAVNRQSDLSLISCLDQQDVRSNEIDLSSSYYLLLWTLPFKCSSSKQAKHTITQPPENIPI